MANHVYNKARFPNATDKFNQDPVSIVEESKSVNLEPHNKQVADSARTELKKEDNE